jgi:hypothetical protein
MGHVVTPAQGPVAQSDGLGLQVGLDCPLSHGYEYPQRSHHDPEGVGTLVMGYRQRPLGHLG